MSHSVRFLALAITAWAGVRAITLGLDPGRDALAATLDDSLLSEAAQGPTAPAPAAPPPAPGMRSSPIGYPPTPYGWMPGYPAMWQAPPAQTVVRLVQPAAPYASPMAIPAYYYAAPPQAMAMSATLPFDPYAAPPPLLSPPPLAAPLPSASPPLQRGAPTLDRLRLHGWAYYRQETGATSAGLAPGGTLGGSQAGARMLYQVRPGLDASARYVSSIGTVRGSEAALGVRYQPFKNIPLAITAERRQRIDGVGRSDFAAFAEYGAYGVRLPGEFSADGFAQAGVVGVSEKDWFLDAQLSATRPVWRDVRAGAGIWTSAQTGLQRVDIGPRLTMPVGNGLTLHADYRLKVAGNAEPTDGASVTIAGDF